MGGVSGGYHHRRARCRPNESPGRLRTPGGGYLTVRPRINGTVVHVGGGLGIGGLRPARAGQDSPQTAPGAACPTPPFPLSQLPTG